MTSISTTPYPTTKSVDASPHQMTTSKAGETSSSTSSKAGATSSSTSSKAGSTSTSILSKTVKKKSKRELEKERMEAEIKEMKELVTTMKAQQEEMREKAYKQNKIIEKQNEEYLELQANKVKKKTGGKPKIVVQYQPHYRFRTIELEDGSEEILMMDSEVGTEIPLYENKVEFTAQLNKMKEKFNNEYFDCSDGLDFFDDYEGSTHDNFGSDLALNEQDVFYLKNRTKYWNEMTKEELIEQCRTRNTLYHFNSRNKDDMVEPNWAKTEKGDWVKWGKGTLYGLKKNEDGTTLKPIIAVNLKSAEGRKQIKTVSDEVRCEANASKNAGRCCKEALFQIPTDKDKKYPTRRVCITHMKSVHQTTIICNKPIAFGGRWGWYNKPLDVIQLGEGKKKSIDEYCKNKLKADLFLETGYKQIKGNNYTRDDCGNSNGYNKFKIND